MLKTFFGVLKGIYTNTGTGIFAIFLFFVGLSIVVLSIVVLSILDVLTVVVLSVVVLSVVVLSIVDVLSVILYRTGNALLNCQGGGCLGGCEASAA